MNPKAKKTGMKDEMSFELNEIASAIGKRKTDRYLNALTDFEGRKY